MIVRNLTIDMIQQRMGNYVTLKTDRPAGVRTGVYWGEPRFQAL